MMSLFFEILNIVIAILQIRQACCCCYSCLLMVPICKYRGAQTKTHVHVSWAEDRHRTADTWMGCCLTHTKMKIHCWKRKRRDSKALLIAFFKNAKDLSWPFLSSTTCVWHFSRSFLLYYNSGIVPALCSMPFSKGQPEMYNSGNEQLHNLRVVLVGHCSLFVLLSQLPRCSKPI